MKMKRITSALIAGMILTAAVPMSGEIIPDFCIAASASETETASGTCGDNLTWVLDDEGTLTISGEGAMYDWNSGNSPWYDYREIIYKIIIDNGVTSIGKCAFDDCFLGSIIIPESVTSIGDAAFAGCIILDSITIPDSVTSIGNYTFEGCTYLTTIVISDSVTSIGEQVFDSCVSLTSVIIPDSVTSIGNQAFFYCGVDSITIENPECEIYDSEYTIYTGEYDDGIDFTGTIYGHEGSTAQAYAEKYGYAFEVISEAALGDLDGDGAVNSSDASTVLSEYALLATGGASSLTEEQKSAADVNKDGAVDSSDASTILAYYAYTSTGGTGSLDEFMT